MLELFIKFCIVGGSGVIIDFSITYLFKEICKWNKYLSNSIGFLVAASSNYIINRIWTFGSKDTDIIAQYSKFIGIAIIGLIINNAVLYLLHVRFKMNFYVAKLLAIGVVTLWNFIMNYLFTF